MNKVLGLPLRDIRVTQPFGVNYLDFYQNLGMKGHNGIDFEARNEPPINATHDGSVVTAGMDGSGGICVEIQSSEVGDGFRTIYYHLKDVTVKVGDTVMRSKLIGHADNTGIYTTGEHLHFGLKLTKDGVTINKDNGYNGAIDPSPYFSDPDWDKSNAFKRYGRKRTWQTFTFNEIPVMLALRKYLKRNPTNEQINACVYGGWDRESVASDAIYEIWGWETKADYLNHKLTF